MFHNVPKEVKERMLYLENLNKKDRLDNTPHLLRLRQIPPETGRFIALLAASAPEGTYLEIGTSAGYSTLWLALACRALKRRIITFEVLEEKADLAQETFTSAGVNDVVELVIGDARDYIENYGNISFCFLDAEKETYSDCYEKVVPRMISGGLLIADNAISHRDILGEMIEKVLIDKRVDALVVPIGSGELLCRKL